MPLKPTQPWLEKPTRVTAVLYRIPLPVTEVLALHHGDSYPLCPRCRTSMEREYMHYCDRCGQRLGWELFARLPALPQRLPLMKEQAKQA